MKKIRRKLLLLMLAFLFFIVISLQWRAVPKIAASISASLYVEQHYGDQDFSFAGVEYESHFGQYFVSFRNGEEQLHLSMYPNILPLFVQHDPHQIGD